MPAGACASLVGAHQAEDHVGVLAQGGPGLLTVDDVVVAIAHRRGLDRGQVRARAGFGVALAPPVRTVQDARQPVVLLLPRLPYLISTGAEHVHAKRHQTGGTGQGALVVKNELLDRAPAGAAVLGRPVVGQPATLVEHGVPAFQVLLGQAFGQPRTLLANAGLSLSFRKACTSARKASSWGVKLQVHIGAPRKDSGVVRKSQTGRLRPCHRQCTW